MTEVRESVKDYYNKCLKSEIALKSNVCTRNAKLTPKIKDAISCVPKEIASTYYGCGLNIPDLIEGCRIIDLGCGSGRDCYVLSLLVGSKGKVVGVDMIEESLEIGRSNLKIFKETIKKEVCDIEFIKGYLEDTGCEENLFDVAISNCVINLCADKEKVFRECHRILKEGGELFFSDMYRDNEIPEEAKYNKELWGNGLSGSLIWSELYDIAERIGFTAPRIFDLDGITVNPELAKLVDGVNYASVTYRLFKKAKSSSGDRLLSSKMVKYVPENKSECSNNLKLDYFLQFQANEEKMIDGEWAEIIETSRYKNVFSLKTISPSPEYEMIAEKINPFELLEN